MGWIGGVGLVVSLEILMDVVCEGTSGKGGRSFPLTLALKLA